MSVKSTLSWQTCHASFAFSWKGYIVRKLSMEQRRDGAFGIDCLVFTPLRLAVIQSTTSGSHHHVNTITTRGLPATSQKRQPYCGCENPILQTIRTATNNSAPLESGILYGRPRQTSKSFVPICHAYIFYGVNSYSTSDMHRPIYQHRGGGDPLPVRQTELLSDLPQLRIMRAEQRNRVDWTLAHCGLRVQPHSSRRSRLFCGWCLRRCCRVAFEYVSCTAKSSHRFTRNSASRLPFCVGNAA